MTETADPAPAVPAVPEDAPVQLDRLRVIVNPSAGHGRAGKVLPAVEAALRGWATDVEVSPTRDIAHADELAAAAAAAGQVAVALGGDGLVGRVAGATAAAGGVLAVLPGGRGNDFARGLGIGRDPVAAATALATAVERRVDLPEAGGTPFIGIASLGFDSEVNALANRTRWLRGQSVYTYAVLRSMVSWRPVRFTVSVDGGEPEQIVGWTVGAANAAYYGGGMRMAPDADIADGKLEVIFIHRCGRLTLLALFPRVFSGRHVDTKHVTVRRAARLTVDADRPFQVYADGDPVADLPAEILVRPGALRLLAPPTS
ncbi:YegS/Rv2252/BmrU family lipid kinase [Frankia sp. AgB1.9]|uniref:diacylglycerol/lipid kinase family protein n=1 Tax=unclassified Frankia TaxID=2632575 RepID=UPI001932F027|nr:MULTISPECIES: YegS/Rv2252/BmrU family lipid kinase [unclassified Frankia]MBL7492698.1 YegS/Rv2252/BmrU family lipid kinase [Frankia sp. AgW1.1]MBL7549686.1 YegS/Rv2252/BmrU family lipid kinase [Frankia sp. AgB1.9]MBL7623143.1 YegS/Rv2252/BmrU family lipid kinase [Frankia sp. AgB1.8]